MSLFFLVCFTRSFSRSARVLTRFKAPCRLYIYRVFVKGLLRFLVETSGNALCFEVHRELMCSFLKVYNLVVQLHLRRY